MNREIFGNHIGSASELTIIADIKPGFVPISQQLTYATRLRQHLQMLGALRRNGLETDRAGVYVGPVDALRTLQYVRWTLIENDTKMLLSVNFDRPVETYIRRIVDIAGPLLDTILCHCENFLKGSSDQGYDGFLEFATRHQVPVELFAAASPNMSVDDGEYFVDLDTQMRRDPAKVGRDFPTLKLESTQEKIANSRATQSLAVLDQTLNILRVMHEGADRFPVADFRGDDSRDDLLYHRLAQRLVNGFLETLQGLRARLPEQLRPAVPFDALNPSVQALQQLTEAVSKTAQVSGRRDLTRIAELFTQFREPLEWFVDFPPLRNIAPPAQAQKGTIQRGLISDGTPPITDVNYEARGFTPNHACILLLRVDDAAKASDFLKVMDARLWPGDGVGPNFNLSITNNGLKALGMDEDNRRSFPQAFREGMAARAGLLGDIEDNHPNEWNWPLMNWPLDQGGNAPLRIPPATIDLIIQVEIAHLAPHSIEFGQSHPLHGEVDALAGEAQQYGVTLLSVEPLQRKINQAKLPIGHLGVVDGISQPKYIGDDGYHPDEREKAFDNTNASHSLLGELLVGHANRLDVPNLVKEQSLPLRDGTFQVVRKTRLDVDSFNQNYRVVCGDSPEITPELVRDKMIGRKADGSPLTQTAQGTQNFNYLNDPKGESTPLQSHIRRANPREFDTPRILRRGYSYGPYPEQDNPTGAERGQMFIAYNANIAEQFEVVQRWVSGGNSTGIASWHGDPLLSPLRNRGTRNFSFMHKGTPVVIEMPEKPMAKLEWGIYAFVPSREGLDALAEMAAGAGGAGDTASQIELPDLASMSLDEIKLLLDSTDDEKRAEKEAIWQHVREVGPISTAYGVLVGDKENVKKVLCDDGSTFSTKTYHERMSASIGPQLLGFDPNPINNAITGMSSNDHHKERAVVDAFLATFKGPDIFETARSIALKRLETLPFETQSRPDDGKNGRSVKPIGRRFEASRFIYDVLAELCIAWFGVPREQFIIGGQDQPSSAAPHCPHSFLAASYYVFTPHPTGFEKLQGTTRPRTILNVLEQHIKKGGSADKASLLGYMLAERKSGAIDAKRWTNRKIAEFVAGACFGFVGPASGGFRSVLFDWIKTENLWRYHQQYQALAGANALNAAKQVLQSPMLESLAMRPVPPMVYRTAVQKTTLEWANPDLERPKGKEILQIAPETRVIAGLRSAIADGGDPMFFLFGGDYSKKGAPPHSCPGQLMGIYGQMGILSALLSYSWIAPQGPMSLWLKDENAP